MQLLGPAAATQRLAEPRTRAFADESILGVEKMEVEVRENVGCLSRDLNSVNWEERSREVRVKFKKARDVDMTCYPRNSGVERTPDPAHSASTNAVVLLAIEASTATVALGGM